MKVQSERDVDIVNLLSALEDKSQCNPHKGMGGYDVRVEKQLLRDAYDVIKQLYKDTKENRRYSIGQKFYIDEKFSVFSFEDAHINGEYIITDIEVRDKENKYRLESTAGKATVLCLSEQILNENKLIS